MSEMSGFHRGTCKKCGTKRLLNKIGLCADCTTFDDYLELTEE